jgi:hypothetical protein
MVIKIISGGQTGVDRVGLDVAMKLGIEHGGYAPKGRIAEDGQIPEKYNLQVLTRGGYPSRTKKNIEASDGTVIFIKRTLRRGCKLTVDYAVKINKPWLLIDFSNVTVAQASSILQSWLESKKIGILNVAGPRFSKDPFTSHMAGKVLEAVLGGRSETPTSP